MGIIDRIKNKIFWWLSFKNLRLPKGTYIDQRGFIVTDNDNFNIGKHVYIGPNATILCQYTKVNIHDHVVIGPNLTIVENDHEFRKVGSYIIDSGLDNKKENEITICKDVWIGANVTILKGVTIGRGSVVAACACVTKSCPPYSIIGGVPAKVIKSRFTEEEIVEHEIILYEKDNSVCNPRI